MGAKMQDGYVSKAGTIAGLLWAWVVGLLIAAWVVMIQLPDHWTWAAMLGFTACASSALAAVVHIKTYACRMSRLIRLSTGLEESPTAGPRSLR